MAHQPGEKLQLLRQLGLSEEMIAALEALPDDIVDDVTALSFVDGSEPPSLVDSSEFVLTLEQPPLVAV